MKTDRDQPCPAWASPLLALQFLTRVPAPMLSRLSADQVRVGMGRAVAWYPLIGALIGAVAAGTIVFVEQWWPRSIAVIVALIVEARLTGAFHEDAVADFCDGAGGGRDPEHARQIMKDSRIGSYGALGLTLAIGLRAALVYSLVGPVQTVLAIVAAATAGRLLAALVMYVTPPAAGESGLANTVNSSVRSRDVALAVAISTPGLLPFALVEPRKLLVAIIACAVFIIWFRSLVVARVGGSTGDCLGFAVYAGQLLVLMAATL